MSSTATLTRAVVVLLLLTTCWASVALAGKLYWRDEGVISRADLDGSNIETVLTGLNGYGGLTVGRGKVYWTDPDDSAIRRADLDGSNVETVLFTELLPLAITLDVDGETLYWVERNQSVSEPDRIRRRAVDGSVVEDVVSDVDNLESIADLALDVANGWVYLTDVGYGVWRARITGPQQVQQLPTAHDLPVGIALDVPGDRLYAANLDLCLVYARLDGTGAGCLPSLPGAVIAVRLAIDLGARELYMSAYSGSGIWRLGLDGGDPTNVVPDVGYGGAPIALLLCGDGVVDAGEECDDGNFVPGDGCEPDCTTPIVVPAASRTTILIAALVLGSIATLRVVRRRSARP